MSHLIRKEGYAYAFDARTCETCGGRCCTGESGNIFVNNEEIKAITVLLKTDIVTFYERYLVKRGYRFSLKERQVGDSYDCIFFDRVRAICTIYSVRPLQCRTFPFWDYFKTHIDELKNECPGIIDE